MAALKDHLCSSGLKRFESKDGQGFTKCHTEICTLFVAEENYTELVEVFQSKVHSKFKPNNFPLCSFWVSHYAENHALPDKNEKCDFFAWAYQIKTKTGVWCVVEENQITTGTFAQMGNSKKQKRRILKKLTGKSLRNLPTWVKFCNGRTKHQNSFLKG
jgi:hypothetical protein